MNIQLNKKETKLLMKILSAGNTVINDVRLNANRIKGYDNLMRKMLSLYLQEERQEDKPVTDSNAIEKKREELYYDVEEYLEYYEEKTLPRTLASAYASHIYKDKTACLEHTKAENEN